MSRTTLPGRRSIWRSSGALVACLVMTGDLPAAAQNAAAAAPQFKMQVAGRDWAATRWMAVKTSIGNAFSLNINGFLDGPKISHVSFLVYPPADGDLVHTYEFKPSPGGAAGKSPANTGSFNVNMLGGNPFDDSFRFQSGALVITGYDPVHKTLSGTFSGKLQNNSGATSIEIVNGQFTDVDIMP